MSFRWKLARPSRSYSRLTIRAPCSSRIRLAANPPSSASRTRPGSMPLSSASVSASPTSSIVPSTMSWLHAFAICPAPTGPRWITREAIASRTGRARARAAASPPAITDRLPAAAATVPPDTGASRYATSRRASSAATWRARPGSIVEVSRTTRPGRPPVAMPSGPSVTLSTAAASGRDSTTTSTSEASAATDAARRAPAAASAASAGSPRSRTTTGGRPRVASASAIGRPIAPRPITPTATVITRSARSGRRSGRSRRTRCRRARRSSVPCTYPC